MNVKALQKAKSAINSPVKTTWLYPVVYGDDGQPVLQLMLGIPVSQAGYVDLMQSFADAKQADKLGPASLEVIAACYRWAVGVGDDGQPETVENEDGSKATLAEIGTAIADLPCSDIEGLLAIVSVTDSETGEATSNMTVLSTVAMQHYGNLVAMQQAAYAEGRNAGDV